jgi:hypothetical protein
MRKEYLIWLDILGFEELAIEIGRKSNVSERKVRDDFVRLLNEKIEEVAARGDIIGKKYGQGDDWLLVTESLDLAFKVISNILQHDTGYKGNSKIPLEIGIGVGKYDNWAKLDGFKLIVENSTIKFLKTHVIDYYCKWYKQTYSRSIDSTFCVLTESAYDELGPLDREICRKVEHRDKMIGNKRKIAFFIADAEKINEAGMVLNFLEKIGRPRSLWYNKINRIFVPPDEYRDMIKNLEKNRIIFLVGDPEIGKTFTAVRMMWEYFSKGYKPIWYSGSEPIERTKARKIMSECGIAEHSVVYFEDPFGRTEFEDQAELRREIGSFVSRVHMMDIRVIITSREEPFRTFEKEKLSQDDLRKFLKEMSLMKPSYDEDRLRMILLNWSKAFSCKWAQKEGIRSVILDEGIKRLRTPLAMKDFALATRDIVDLEKIECVMEEKSKETKDAFAEEIAKMDRKKVLFLSILYILHLKEESTIENLYMKTCKNLGIDVEPDQFKCLMKYFENKISLNKQENIFEFTHPSYEEGLVRSWNKPDIRNEFLRMIRLLTKEEDPIVRGLCGFNLIRNLGELSFKEEAKTLIETAFQDRNASTRNGIAEAINHFFSNIPYDTALDYLSKMSNDRNREIRANAIRSIGNNLTHIPLEHSLILISKGLEDRAALVRLETASVVRANMETFPQDLVMKALKCFENLCSSYTGWFLNYFACIEYRIMKKEVEEFYHKHVKQDSIS